ncbi:MAG: biopolymer transporter ExbD [Acidobacteriota bacterium]
MESCLGGEPDAWEALILRYQRLIYSIPIRSGFSPVDAADIFQSVCLKLFQKLVRLDHHEDDQQHEQHIKAKLPVKAPERASGIEEPSPETLMLTVAHDMRLELNSKPIEVGELLPLLADLMEQRPLDTRTLFIKAPPMLAYGPVVLLIDLAKGAGVVTVGLVKDEG